MKPDLPSRSSIPCIIGVSSLEGKVIKVVVNLTLHRLSCAWCRQVYILFVIFEDKNMWSKQLWEGILNKNGQVDKKTVRMKCLYYKNIGRFTVN